MMQQVATTKSEVAALAAIPTSDIATDNSGTNEDFERMLQQHKNPENLSDSSPQSSKDKQTVAVTASPEKQSESLSPAEQEPENRVDVKDDIDGKAELNTKDTVLIELVQPMLILRI